ncbi:hypothetical protein C8R46DRAFT_1015571 [Mycena filopes]|nr:hypothetical protein C8R46DRAFT_1015571 [Mycena filopes]
MNRRRSPPAPDLPSARHWADSSERAQETIERHVEAHEQHRLRQLGGGHHFVPPLLDLVGDRLSIGDPDTIRETLEHLPPVFLQNNLWKWLRMPYTLLRQTVLRLLYNGAAEGVEWDQSTSTDLHNNIDEWILANEKCLRNADPLQWQHGLVNLDDAEHAFPNYTLTRLERTITRPRNLPGFHILSFASAPRITIRPSTAAFKKHFDRMSDRLLRNLDWSNLIVAGGIVLGALLCDNKNHWESSDIDIYIHGLAPLEANKKIRHIFDTFVANLPPGTRTFAVRNSKTITFYAKYPLRRVQIVLKLLRSPREVLLNFDLDICAMGWDGSDLWMLPRAARALETGTNVFTTSLIHGHYLSERRASQPQRVFKYASRGYGLRFLPSYVSSLTKAKSPSGGEHLDLAVLAEQTRRWTQKWVEGTYNYPNQALSPLMLPGYSLSGFCMLMRPVSLWEMGQVGDLTLLDLWSRNSPYEDAPAKSPDPEFPWTPEFTITDFLTHIHNCNAREVRSWLREDSGDAHIIVGRLEAHGVRFGYEICDAVRRMAGAPTLELLLHPQHDICLPVLLPCSFAVYANDLISRAQADAGLQETKLLEPAVPQRNYFSAPGDEREGLFIWRITPELMWQQVDRRIDEVFEALYSFRRVNADLPDEQVQAQRFSDELSRRETRRTEGDKYESFARWVGKRPLDVRHPADNEAL